MSLQDLDKELYNPHSKIDRRRHEESQFDPSISAGADASRFRKEKEWIVADDGTGDVKRKALKIGAISVVILAVLGLGIWLVAKFKESAFSEDRVIIEIDGPKEINSSDAVLYRIKFKNDNRVALKDAEVFLNYTENFRPEENVNLKQEGPQNSKIYVGEIKSHSQGEVELKGNFYAPKDYVVYLGITLKYTPSNFNSVFEAKTQLGINVKSSPIFLEATAPLEAASGNNVEYVVDYKNLSTLDFNDLRIKIDYPDGFEFKSSDPRSSEGNNFWYLGSLGPSQGGKIKIEGTLTGSRNESKVIKVSLGISGRDGQFVVYNEREKNTRIVASPLSIRQTVNGLTELNVNGGDQLNYAILFRNDGELGIRNAIVTLEIKSAVLDFSKLQLQKGSYDSTRGVITWKAVDIAELANLEPGKGGEIKFSVPVLEKIPVKNDQDKNFTIESVAKIDSPDVPTPLGSNKIIASNNLFFKLNSKVVLETNGYYKDANIENSGPIPPQVGKETTYTIHWLITNVSNDISDTRVVSSLPTGVKWMGKIYPDKEKVAYNERTNEIVWEIGKLESATGILDPKKEVAFQVSIVPEINQVGNSVTLVNSSNLTAKDLFTSENLKAETKEKTTRLPEDTSISSNGYNVVQSAD